MVRTKSAYFSYLAIFLCSFSYVWSGVLSSASGFLSPRSKNPLADFLMPRFLNARDRVYAKVQLALTSTLQRCSDPQSGSNKAAIK